MTADTQELAALWAAIDAMPEDALRRLVLADFLDERAGFVKVECPRCKGTLEADTFVWVGSYPASAPMRKEPIGKQPCFLCENEWQEPTGLVYTPDGRADLARALRATSDRVPFTSVPQAGERAGIRYWAWVAGASDDFKDTVEVRIFDRLAGEIVGDHTNFRDYPTASAAIRDLCRAYIAVHCKSEVLT